MTCTRTVQAQSRCENRSAPLFMLCFWFYVLVRLLPCCVFAFDIQDILISATADLLILAITAAPRLQKKERADLVLCFHEGLVHSRTRSFMSQLRRNSGKNGHVRLDLRPPVSHLLWAGTGGAKRTQQKHAKQSVLTGPSTWKWPRRTQRQRSMELTLCKQIEELLLLPILWSATAETT